MTVRRGPEFIAEVSAHRPPKGGLSFWWLGQHSVIVKLAGKVVYIDPYLAPDGQRRVPPLFSPKDVTNADWVLCTHDHGDHLDPRAIPGIAAASPEARFIAPKPARARMLELGVSEDRLVGMDDKETLEDGTLKFTGVKAAHEFFDHVEGVGHPYMGYVVEAGKSVVYHPGDTVCYDGLLGALQWWRLTVALLPINGRDGKRYRASCIGNMTYQEAADLAGLLLPRLVVPTHYDMFASNAEDPDLFVDYLDAKFPGQEYWAGEPGVAVDVCP